MKDLIASFDQQLIEAVDIAESAHLKTHNGNIHHVVITGLGGSGIGGKIVADIIRPFAKVPIVINNDYTLPSFVDDKTLVIVSSYSGNTEETLSAMDMAQKSGAEIACITSGGEVEKRAKDNGFNHIIVPGGNPPRACLGYSMVQQFRLMHHYGIIEENFVPQIKKVVSLIRKESDFIQESARNLAEAAKDKTPILYAGAAYEGVMIRLRQQLNENSKALCWHHVLPEMNHNELVGWGGGKDEYQVFLFRAEDDHQRTSKRMDLSSNIMAKKAPLVEIHSKGNSHLERSFYLINLGDWMSWYLSELNGVDAIEIDVINYLKGELAKF